MKSLKDRRVLVLEDEPLIAMMTSQLIREMGGVVLGPYSDARKAAGAISEALDVALLDVNIAGDFAYPLADHLCRLGVPVIFMTGYQAGAIEPRFSECPVLTKPVDRDDLAVALARAVTNLEVMCERPAMVERTPPSHL